MDNQVVDAVEPNFEKYTNALALMDQVAEAADVYRENEFNEDLKIQVNAKWDNLYTYVYANFKQPETSTESGPVGYSDKEKNEMFPLEHPEVQSMIEMFNLGREEIEARLQEIPPTILEQCFPVWMARYLLRFRRVAVQPGLLTTFSKFHFDYGYMIIFAAGAIRRKA
jgi:hypothetical protein